MKSTKKPLDPVVKMGIGLFLGGFCLIAFGMYLSRPDRSIPPYSVGTQNGALVSLHVPSWTSDPELESLINRFGEVGRKTRDFALMKIRPTTPDNPDGRYQRIRLIIFSDPTWTEPDTFQRYVGSETTEGQLSSDEDFRRQFEAHVRAGYRADDSGQAGWIGPWNRRQSKDRTLTMQWIFEELWTREKTGTISSQEEKALTERVP